MLFFFLVERENRKLAEAEMMQSGCMDAELTSSEDSNERGPPNQARYTRQSNAGSDADSPEQARASGSNDDTDPPPPHSDLPRISPLFRDLARHGDQLESVQTMKACVNLERLTSVVLQQYGQENGTTMA